MRRGVMLAAMIGVLLVLGPPVASALPLASGSFCKSDWVNNAGAMACFGQGQTEISQGVAHPHYVACTPNGDVYCCKDNNHGGQDCEPARTSGNGINQLLSAIIAMQGAQLSSQQKVIVDLKGIIASLGDLQLKMDDLHNACAPPDLFPVPIEGSTPPGYCRPHETLPNTLVVRVRNGGFSDAVASTLRVTFTTPGGPVVANVPTPALNWGGGTVDLAVPIPATCGRDAAGGLTACNFVIAVDATGVVAESDEINNIVAGACVPIF